MQAKEAVEGKIVMPGRSRDWMCDHSRARRGSGNLGFPLVPLAQLLSPNISRTCLVGFDVWHFAFWPFLYE